MCSPPAAKQQIYMLTEIATSGSTIMLMHWSSLCSSAPAYMLHHITYSMCITKMYDMLNKISLGLLKKGAAKQSEIKKGVKHQ